MTRRYNTRNNYNIVGFHDLYQEFIRIVRYVPENRLVCVPNACGNSFWNHPDDIGDESKCVQVAPDPDGISFYDDRNNPFVEVSYEEIAAAGWEKYLRIFRSDYDFNEANIHAAHEDDTKLTLTMWGGFIGGRRLFTDSIPRTNRFFLHIHKPFTIRAGVFDEELLTDRFPEWFDAFASGGAEPVLFTETYSDGTGFVRFHVRNPKGERTQLCFESRHMEVEIDRTDWRLQCIGDELDNLRRMEWRYRCCEPYSDTWTHEHCILCNACIEGGEGMWMNEPIQTEKTIFICTDCMKDFEEYFMKTDYPYIITEQHANVSGDPSPILLHDAYTSSCIFYDGNDLVFPMQNGFIIRPNCPPNITGRYLQTGAAEIRLRNVKNILDRGGGETPCVGQQFTFLRHEYRPETGVFILDVLNLRYGQVVFEFLCDAVEYRFSSMEDTSWMQQALDSLNKDRKE